MTRRPILTKILVIILIGILGLSFKVQSAEASRTIYIRADGSIDPPTANITSLDNVTFTLIGNINDSIVIERDNIVIDGTGYTVQGCGTGITLSGRSNITIKNTEITNNVYGISLNSSSNSSISRNNITSNFYGITLHSPSSYNSIHGNNITANNGSGISLYSSSYNSIHGNNITANSMGSGISLHDSSSYNSIHGNNITANSIGLYGSSSYNSIHGNNITANNIYLGSSNNSIYHNNFANNTNHIDYSSMNVWDDGYPSGGNYWSSYAGVDSNHDGIGDTVHVIDGNNTDKYPLKGMYSEFNTTLEHHIQIVCNSSLSNFGFNGTVIVFDVAGKDDTAGFCRICIPTDLINETYRIFANRTEVQYSTLSCSNTTHRYLYFNYAHPKGKVIIINADWYRANPLMGDVNRDMKVDMKDLLTAAESFGFRSSDPKWDPYTDVTRDGTINIKDFATIVRHFGEHYP